MIVVTSGKKYMDIDAYAGCIAYAKLLNLKGIKAKAISTAKLNESITSSLLDLNIKLDKYKPRENDEYVIIDVSNKDYFDIFVKEEKIIEIIDHHAGYEKYWKDKLNQKSQIEFIGSVATMIVELYEKENLIHKISKDLAILLISAILDNTLNLKAKITTKRDRIAYKKLETIIKDKTYPEKYFKECQSQIEQNLKLAIENDTKVEQVNCALPPIFGQLVVWDKKCIINKKEIIYSTLNNIGNKWMINLICLKEGKSYIMAKNLEVKKNLEILFNKQFNTDIMEFEEVWLRKEIMKMEEKIMYNRPINTLFMLMSLDGKINSGDSDELDVDRDWCKIDGVKEGLHQYYEIEKTTDWYSLNTVRVMAKIGVNERKEKPQKIDCRFIIIDRKPHLNEKGIEYLCNWVDILFLVTDNKDHPAYKLTDKFENLKIVYYENIDLTKMMEDLKNNYDVERITIQSGGTLNCEFLRKNLIDYVNIVIAPILVGGSTTNTLIDGKAISKVEELNQLKALELIETHTLQNSYIQLKYKVLNNKTIGGM